VVRRREFITLVGGAAAWPLAARAQEREKIRRIGIIDDAPMWRTFRQSLRELGYIDGQIRRPVDLIAVFGTPATQAAKAATTTIPIVMVGVGDAVRSGLVASLARPGGNITGNTVLAPDLSPKRLQILRDAIPNVRRIAYLANPDNTATLDVLAKLKATAVAAGMAVIGVEFGSTSDFDSALNVMLRERAEALIVSNDPFHQLHVNRIIAFLTQHRLASLFQAKENAEAGGLMAYGPSLTDLFRLAGGYVHRILQGTRPSDLPVQQPTKFELVINMRTAEALGVTVPVTLQAIADEVIE
jgi:putative tryptophan/tyrosine transport system substrate-binding protein